MPHDKTITTDIASTGESNLFVEPSASLGGVRERPPTARPSGGKRIVRLDSSPVDSLPPVCPHGHTLSTGKLGCFSALLRRVRWVRWR